MRNLSPHHYGGSVKMRPPSLGGVTGYLLERFDPVAYVTNSVALPASPDDFEDSTINQTPASQWYGPMLYRLQAQYGAIGSAWTSWAPLYSQDTGSSAFFLRGPQGRPYLAVGGLPQWASTVSVVWVDASGSSTNWVLPASVLTNGAYAVPNYWVPADPTGGSWYLDILDSNGTLQTSISAAYPADSVLRRSSIL